MSEEPVSRSGDGADDEDGSHKWAFFNSLLFLKDTCTPRTTEGNFSAEDTDNILSGDGGDGNDLSDLDTNINDDSSSQVSFSESISDSRPASAISTTTPVSTTAKKAKIQRVSSKRDALGESLIRVEEEKIGYLKRKEESRQKRQKMAEENARNKEIDEDESFFNSILPHVKTFDSRAKMKFRIGVLQLVEKFLSKAQNENTQSFTEEPREVIEKYPLATQKNNVQSTGQHFQMVVRYPSTTHQNNVQSSSGQFQMVEKYHSTTQQNNIQSSTESHLTELTAPQIGHSAYFPHNSYTSGNVAPNSYHSPDPNNHFEN